MPLGRRRVHTSILESRSNDIARMTSTMIGDPTVLSTIPVYNPPPVTRAPQGQPVIPAPHQGQPMTPHQGQQMTPTGQAGASSGGDMLSRVSVTSGQVAINWDKCMFTLSPGRFAAVSKYRGRVLIHVRDYVIDALSGKMYATKRGVAMKVDEWENLKLNMYAIDAAISVHLQEK